MLAAVYGLQALIFILKRQWQHIGWMLIYMLAFPIYSFVLPIYSFWNQDNFTWGNTRIVIGEKGNKQVVAVDDEGFDPRSIPLQRWDDYALANNLPGRRGNHVEKAHDLGYDDTYELDEIKSMYSSVKPASTILTGFPNRNSHSFMPPQSPAPFMTTNRQSVYNIDQDARTQSPYQDFPLQQSNHPSILNLPGSSDNLLGQNSATPSSPRPPQVQNRASTGYSGGARNPLGSEAPISVFDFQRSDKGPSDIMIVETIQNCLREVDLDNVTKKQVRALVEQRLQTELTGERRTFMDRMIDAELASM